MDLLNDLEISQEPLFSEEEFDSRLKQVRANMESQGVDLLLLHSPESIFYLTGYHTFGGGYGCLFVPLEGELRHLLRFLESFLSKLYSRLDTDSVVIWDDTDDPVEITAEVIREYQLEGSNIGYEAEYVSSSVSCQLGESLPKASFQSADRVIQTVRDTKSPKELEYMEKAGSLSVKGAIAALEAICRGATDNDVAAAAAEEMLREGSEYMPHDPIVTSGNRSGIPHTTFERNVIEEGDTILIEHTACFHRYHAPIMRSAVLGTPSEKIQEMSDVLMEALDQATEKMAPGVTSGEVDKSCRSVIENAGYYENFRKRTGYSVGLSWPEHLDLKKDDPLVLKPGMVFHLPVALRDYGKAIVGFSPTVKVTEDGVETITEYPSGVEVIQ